MRGAVLLTSSLCALLLVGCTSSPVGPPASPSASAGASEAPRPTPTTPPPTQSASGAKPIDISCRKLLPSAVAKQIRPDLKLVKGWTPDAGSPAANAVDLKGTACLWRDGQGDTIEVAVSKPSAKDATALKNDLVNRSNSVPTYGGEAYFQVQDGTGVVNAFRGRTWVATRSNLFYEPGDASDVVAASLAALGLGPTLQSPSDGGESPAATPTPTPTPTPTASAAG